MSLGSGWMVRDGPRCDLTVYLLARDVQHRRRGFMYDLPCGVVLQWPRTDAAGAVPPGPLLPDAWAGTAVLRMPKGHIRFHTGRDGVLFLVSTAIHFPLAVI